MHICVVGAGYVGVVVGTGLAQVGHHVVCVDINQESVSALNQAVVPFYEPGLEERLSGVLESGRFQASTDLHGAVAHSELTMIAVGTPAQDKGIDLSFIGTVSEQVGYALRDVPNYHVVAVKSTVVPGTTDTLVRGIIERTSGREIGEFGLCMNPEFLREGSAINDFMQPDRIIIGQWDEPSGTHLARLYEHFDCPLLFTTLRNAELIKYASNALLATLISFSNEIAALCEVSPDTDIDEVMDALHLDGRLSPLVHGQRVKPGILSYLRAGSGFGGSCLPKDLDAIREYARGQGLQPWLLDAVVAVNKNRPAQLVDLAKEALGSLQGRTVTVLGIAFKPGTSDVRDSPALPLIDELLAQGAVVRGYDPKAGNEARVMLGKQVHVFDNPELALSEADAAFIATAWPEFACWDWGALAGKMRTAVIIDGRNMLRNVNLPKDITYLPVGRKPQAQVDGR